MFSKLHPSSDYPRLYTKFHKCKFDRPFISPHLNCQSIVTDGSTVHRSPCTGEHITKFGDIQTMHDVFEHGLQVSRYEKCLGFRNKVGDQFTWLTFDQVNEMVIQLGSALRRMINELQIDSTLVGIYAPNSPEWFMTQNACAAYSLTIVPLYDTLGMESLQHILSQTDLQMAVCMSAKQATHLLDDFETQLRLVIVIQDSPELQSLKAKHEARVDLFSDFLKYGQGEFIMHKQPAEPDSLCMICYTSGTTDKPKGVMIEHQQFTAAVLAVIETTEDKCCRSDSIHFSYLPRAHLLEQVNSSIVTANGARTAFLTNANIKNLLADVADVGPTLFTGVPRVFETIRTNYFSRLGQNCIKLALFNYLVNKKMDSHRRGEFYHNSLLDHIFFDKLRTALGGNIYGVISGGAAIPNDLSIFIRTVFDGFLTQGYGSTETGGVITTSLPGEYRSDVLGAVAYGVEVQLQDVPDLDIVVDRDNKGEICVRGKQCTKGYYKDKARTEELIDADGWVHTGDIGRWDSCGALKMEDRIKSIFKLSQGEYVSPEKLESAYRGCTLINQIMVDGDSRHNYPIGIIVPEFVNLRKEFSHLDGVDNLNNLDDETLCEQEVVKRLFIQKMDEIANKANFNGFEKVKAVHLTASPFTVDNNLLTPSLKVIRPKVREFYATHIQNLYRK